MTPNLIVTFMVRFENIAALFYCFSFLIFNFHQVFCFLRCITCTCNNFSCELEHEFFAQLTFISSIFVLCLCFNLIFLRILSIIWIWVLNHHKTCFVKQILAKFIFVVYKFFFEFFFNFVFLSSFFFKNCYWYECFI